MWKLLPAVNRIRECVAVRLQDVSGVNLHQQVMMMFEGGYNSGTLQASHYRRQQNVAAVSDMNTRIFVLTTAAYTV